MATIHNTDLTKELKEGAKLQQLRDLIPSQLADKVVPVMEVNPKLLRRINIVRYREDSNSTGGVIYTTPTDKDFYLCGVTMEVIKDATATSVASTVTIVPKGEASVRIVTIPGFTLTAQNSNQVKDFTHSPILLERASTVVSSNSTNVGNVKAHTIIYGYIVDNSLA